MRAARSLPSLTMACASIASACVWTLAHAQVDLYSLEAAYVYNFTQFTQWPAAHTSDPLAVCVNPRTELGAALAKLDGRTVSGRAWHVQPVPEGAAIAACNVLIIEDAASNAASKSASARDVPILVIRAAEADAGDGPSIVTLVRDGERLRFDIDNKEAARRRVALSSKLLRLARNVT